MTNITQPLTSLTFSTLLPVTSRIPELSDVVTPADRIPPFQISRPNSTGALAAITVEAIYPGTGAVIDLKALLDAADPMQLVALTDGTDRIIWPQALPLTANLDGGRFYVKVHDGETTWYSRYLLNVKCGAIVTVLDIASDLFINETEISIL